MYCIPDISGPYQSVSEVDLVDLEAHFRWMTSSEFQVVSTQEWKIQKLDNPNGKLISTNAGLFITVKPTKPWTLEIFQECLFCSDLSDSEYQCKTCELATKPQTNIMLMLFSFLTPVGLFSCYTITFQKYFWCSWFCWFDSNNFNNMLQVSKLVGKENSWCLTWEIHC